MDIEEVAQEFLNSLNKSQREQLKLLSEMYTCSDGKKERSIDSEIVKALMDLGVPADMKGFRYLRTAIKIAYCDPSVMDRRITKILYPAVAEFHRTTPGCVERAIRHAIEVGYSRSDYETYFKYFGYSVNPEKGKPVNGQFIAVVLLSLERD